MDQASPNFHGVTADVQMITYTAILGDQTTETGTLKMHGRRGTMSGRLLSFRPARTPGRSRSWARS